MSRNLTNSGLYDVNMIDDRNERPLTIAFATIVTMWLLRVGLVFVSTHLNAESVRSRKALRRSRLDRPNAVAAVPELSSGKRESPTGPSGCRPRSVSCITPSCGEL
jgi:hypothetical protein